MATGWDTGRVFYHNTLGTAPRTEGTSNTDSDKVFQQKCLAFLEQFRIENQFIYREQLRRNIGLQNYSLTIDMTHIQAFDEHLATQLMRRPAEMLPLLERAAILLAKSIMMMDEINENQRELRDPFADFQVELTSATIPMTIRNLDASHISKMIRVPGIVVSASSVVSRPTDVKIMCRGCKQVRSLKMASSFGPISLPRKCPGGAEVDVNQPQCPLDPYTVLGDRSHCVDQQTMKLQESPEMVPVGELPRQVLLSVDRHLVNRISPGTRVIVTGIYSIFQSNVSSSKNVKAVAIRTPFIKVVGFQIDCSSGTSNSGIGEGGKGTLTWSESEEREMLAISRLPDLYERFSRSIAPSIFGNDDIKKAIACMLFGGSRKLLPDRIRLRGDINVLLLGDPGVAKSQFLKFVEKVAPISVYTSGKGSSAAGLTASVIRDPNSGDFYLEGGAMVLADGGVVCIDEFDKMDNEDRVAIHEAMEQQTISIAKAGITTILNSRTSVLAAANPVFGRYDEMKTPGENIDFSTTILSRFDMIFVLKDEHNAQRDMALARHVLSVHMNANAMDQNTGDFDLATMRKYLNYCRTTCAPRLSNEAAELLAEHYKNIRSRVHKMEQKMTERSSIPITIRQLEAIVRIAEALAKMCLSPVATEQHVEEAIRLFTVSTMQAVISGHSLEGMTRPELVQDVDRVEKAIRQRLPVGSSVSYRNLVQEMVQSRHFSEPSVLRAIDIMVQQEKLLFRAQRKVIVRQH